MELICLVTVLPKVCFSTITFQDLFCSYLPRDFRNFTNFCFPENILAAAANRFKVLKIFISLKVTVYMQDHRLQSQKALDAQSFEWKSACTEMAKYTCDFKHRIYCIQQNLAEQFTLHSAKAYPEPFPTSKEGGYFIGSNNFPKKLHPRSLKRF